MSTVSHIIYSHYDPKDRERLERETGQRDEQAEAELSWATEPPSYRNQAPAPRFVPATLTFDMWDIARVPSHQKQDDERATNSNIVDWYRSLRKSLDSGEVHVQCSHSAATTQSQRASAPLKSPLQATPNTTERRDKNNWFIMNAMHSEPPSPSATPKPRPPPPTLADILARDPPPKPNEPKYIPPVFLEIGPSNKGFAMLQRRGWNEGEALGPDIIRQKRRGEDLDSGLFWERMTKNRGRNPSRDDRRKGKTRATIDVKQIRPEDIIDLSRSDSESDTDLDDEPDGDITNSLGVITPSAKLEPTKLSEDSPPLRSASPSLPELAEREEDITYGRKALITPLATVLKSDRLGIGLKAKTIGPYKASRKRVTHNAAALAAHVKAGEELQMKKRELGRGRRGFERQYRKEAMRRQMMLAYLNS